MPVSVIPSAPQTTKQKSTARKRRRNQNVEIDELAALVPLATPLAPPDTSLVPSGGKPPAIDKISVLRLTSTFLKLQNFMKEASPAVAGRRENGSVLNSLGLMEEAMDGFLIVLDKDANVLYASETITGYVGLSQQDVIGQNLIEISHEESAVEITDNLKPSATPPLSMVEDCIVSQFRQFYVRFRSTLSPSRMQLSRFTSHTMVQVSGNLKVKLPPSSNLVELVEPSVIGFLGECRLIESASSILELSVPHSTFTMTKSLDMKIISVESTVKDIVGYEPEDLLGDCKLVDFFHPADYKMMVPCEKFLMRTGHAVSPHFRFLTSSGDWVWMQLEATLRYKSGTAIPQFWEIKARVLSQGGGKLKYIEQKELYASNPDPDQDLLNPHRDIDIIPKLANKSNHCKEEEGGKSIINSLKNAKLPDSVLEPVLHARSVALSKIPNKIEPLLSMNAADDFVKQRNKDMLKRKESYSSIATSPPSTLSPASSYTASTHGGSPPATSGVDVPSARKLFSSRNVSLSSSIDSPSTSMPSPPISPPTQLVSPSPGTPSSGRGSNAPPPSSNGGGRAIGNGAPQTRSPAPSLFTQVQKGGPAIKPTADQGGKPHLDVESYSQMMVAPSSEVKGQNGVQSPPSVCSSGVSSPFSSVVAQNGHRDNHIGSGGSFSETPSPASSSMSAVSSPPSVFSPEVANATQPSATSSNSVPPPTSANTMPFQDFLSSGIAHQSPFGNFNPQIPQNFNFNGSSTTTPHLHQYHPASTVPGTNFHSAAFNPGLDNSVRRMDTDHEMLDASANSFVNPNDPVIHQLLGEVVALNTFASQPNGSVNTTLQNFPRSAPTPSNFYSSTLSAAPEANQVNNNNLFAMSCDVAMTQLNVANGNSHHPQAYTSNSEVQDILQQFQ